MFVVVLCIVMGVANWVYAIEGCVFDLELFDDLIEDLRHVLRKVFCFHKSSD